MNIKNLFHKKPLDLEKIYNENKHYFELLLCKDFVGYIPKEIQEPVINNFFKEYGEQMERWTMWHSWYINRKALNDPQKITFYAGMMVYLKVLNTLAKVNKKNYQPEPKKMPEVEVGTSWIQETLDDIKYFTDNVNKTNQADKGTEGESPSKV